VLGYLCGLEALLCSLHSLRAGQYDRMEESSTHLTLQQGGAASRAVTSDSIVPARPLPPPPPRPIVRSQAGQLDLRKKCILKSDITQKFFDRLIFLLTYKNLLLLYFTIISLNRNFYQLS
jgi:hypothetical protein